MGTTGPPATVTFVGLAVPATPGSSVCAVDSLVPLPSPS